MQKQIYFSSKQYCAFLSHRCWAKAIRRSTPHPLSLLSLPHHPPTQRHLAPLHLLLAAVLLFDSPARLRPASAPLCSPHPRLPPVSLHSAPSRPCQAAVRFSLWQSSSPLGLALQIPTVSWVHFLLKVRKVHQGIKYIRKDGFQCCRVNWM